MHENDLLAALPDLFRTGDPDVLVGTGPDDCALVRTNHSRLALSVDAFVENTHFLADADPADIARKALAASLSDLAASACRARWVLVSLCMRRGLGEMWARRFAEGLAGTAREFGVSVVGGDTVSSPDATFVSVTVAGEPLEGGPLSRSGGRPGDILAVTGSLGGTLLGRHLRPTPRLREIRLLMEYSTKVGLFPTAAMDISDGLALDLSRLCRESGVGAVVDKDAIPLSVDARRTSEESGRSPVWHALADGEDFELLVAMPHELWRGFDEYCRSGPGLKVCRECAPFTRIGELVQGTEMRLRTRDGVMHPLAPEGYQHQW